MVEQKKVAFITAAVAEDVERQHRMIHWLQRSCDRFDIPLIPYGLGHGYGGWRHIKIELFCGELKRLQGLGYTHVFYTDGRDSFMLCGADEVLEKYNAMGAPAYLISCEDQCYPFPEMGGRALGFSRPKQVNNPWKWLGAGQMVGEIAYMLELWEVLKGLYGHMPEEDHDQGWLCRAVADRVMEPMDPGKFVLDHDCVIFQTASVQRLGGDIKDYVGLGLLEVRGARVYNTVTATQPCAIHFPGGYTSPTSGKDHALGPVWGALYADDRDYVRERMRELEPATVSEELKAWITKL